MNPLTNTTFGPIVRPHIWSPVFQQALQTNSFKSKTIQKYITGFMLTQMTATASIKKHGQRAIEALMNEFLQLHNKDIFEPMHAHKLTNDQKRRALRAINLIKEKRCGKLKGRTVADGSMQRNRYTKEETTSPTISVDALMLTLLVNAKEKRDVATADVEGAYLHADMDEFVLCNSLMRLLTLLLKYIPCTQNM